jgi:hypothetical protein
MATSIRLFRLGVAVLVIATGLVVAQFTSAGTASAAISGLEYVWEQTTDDSNGLKSHRTYCPAGKRAIGGAAIASAETGGHVRITKLQPTRDYFVAAAAEDEQGFSGNWTLYVEAVCADPLPGLEYVLDNNQFGPALSHTSVAACPPGKQVIGMGGTVSLGHNQAILTEVFKYSNPERVQAKGHVDDTGFGGDWGLWATAVCANPIDRLQVVSALSPSDSVSPKPGGYTEAKCPIGYEAYSFGGAIVPNNGQVQMLASWVGTDHTLFFAQEDWSGYSGNWLQINQAICVP